MKQAFIIFDNHGTKNATLDRYTIVLSDGEIFGCNSEPFHGIGQYSGNVVQMLIKGAASMHYDYVNGCWKKDILQWALREYLKEAKMNPEWLGKPVKFSKVPEQVQLFIAQISADILQHER